MPTRQTEDLARPASAGVSRRGIIRTTAWAAPAVLIATATPAAAASGVSGFQIGTGPSTGESGSTVAFSVRLLSAGLPVAGAIVGFTITSANATFVSSGTTGPVTAVTGPDGTASTPVVLGAPGTVTIAVSAAGYSGNSYSITTTAAAPAVVADWGVKTSFRNYIALPFVHGSIATSAGASVNSDGTYRFSAGSGTVSSALDAGTVAYSGAVRFQGHPATDGSGLSVLDSTFSNIRVSLSGTPALIVDAAYRQFGSTTSASPIVTANDVVFATIDLSTASVAQSDGYVTVTAAPTTLTAAGAAAFGGFYPASTAIDPITFVAKLV